MKSRLIFIFKGIFTPPIANHQVIITTYLLQVKLDEDWQVPFHLLGGRPNPSSLKLSDSGQIPVSSMPMIMSFSYGCLFAFTGKFIKFHDLVVRSCLCLLGMTDTTSFMPGTIRKKQNT